MRDNNIPTVVWLCPILPFINDTKANIKGILDYCIEAKVYGIICFDMGLTLRDGNREYYYKHLDKYFPRLKQVYQKKYGNNYIIPSDNNQKLMKLFRETCQKHNIVYNIDEIFKYLNHFPEPENKKGIEQLTLF